MSAHNAHNLGCARPKDHKGYCANARAIAKKVAADQRIRDIAFLNTIINGIDDELLIESANDALNRIIAGTGA